jgi:hypothetical protein
MRLRAPKHARDDRGEDSEILDGIIRPVLVGALVPLEPAAGPLLVPHEPGDDGFQSLARLLRRRDLVDLAEEHPGERGIPVLRVRTPSLAILPRARVADHDVNLVLAATIMEEHPAGNHARGKGRAAEIPLQFRDRLLVGRLAGRASAGIAGRMPARGPGLLRCCGGRNDQECRENQLPHASGQYPKVMA